MAGSCSNSNFVTKWGLPLPHLVISKIRISSKKNFCQNSQIFIDELERPPLPYRNLVSSEKSIDLIRAKNVEVRLVDLELCLSNKPESPQRKTNAVVETEENPAGEVQKSTENVH